MHPRRIPGSDVNLGLAAAFVAALALLVYTDPAASRPQWEQARQEVQQEQITVEVGLPAAELQTVELRARGDECDNAVS